MNTKTFAAAVGAGAALLDSVRPLWYEEIDLYRLDMGKTSVCILGQLYDHEKWEGLGYSIGLEAIGLKPFIDEDTFGFCGDGESDDQILYYLWVEQIAARKN